MTAALAVVPSVVALPERSDDLVLLELFNGAETLVELFQGELAQEHWLDAYLLGAGLTQILEDHATARRDTLRRAAAYFSGLDGRSRRLAMLIETAEQALTRAGRLGRPASLAPAIISLRPYLELLASALLASAAPHDAPALRAHGLLLVDSLRPVVGDVAGDLLRMPSCFRSFDQRPEDWIALSEMFAERRPDRSAPVTVVGLRTSGSYIAPIVVAALREAGYAEVEHCTVRPSWPIPTADLQLLRATSASGGSIIVVDDPPTTGRSVAEVVRQLRAVADCREQAIVVMLGLFTDLSSSPALKGLEVIGLPLEEWGVQSHLRCEAVARDLEFLLGGVRVRDVQSSRAHQIEVQPRGHLRALYDVTLEEFASGIISTRTVVAEGAGLGYLGRHLLGVSRAAPQLFPEVFGLLDGISYRAFLPSSDRLDRGEVGPAEVGRQVAVHLARRKAALPVTSDRSVALAGRQPAWEIAARISGRVFGRYAPVFRPGIVDPLLRQILSRTSLPSITDGSPAAGSWFGGPCGAAVKIDFAEGPFGHLDLASYDALSNLAAAAVSFDAEATTVALREEFERLTGEAVDPAKWVLYQLVHLWNARRMGSISVQEERRSSSRALQAFFAENYLGDLPAASGPFVALDLDGCLETSPLGFPATTAAGALALRGLRAHGFRVVLASGRSKTEVAERLASYGLVGGAAEYGAYIVLPGANSELCLLSSRARHALDLVRVAIGKRHDLAVDHDFRGVVRVRSREASHPRGIGGADAARILQEIGQSETLRVIAGEEQTDFSPIEIDKGLGLRSLLCHLSEASGRRPLAATIGDSESDLAMFAVAQRSFAPGNAARGLRAAGLQRLSHKYQLGCAQAASAIIGHRVGSCPKCAPPPLCAEDDAIVRLLSIHEGGPRHAIGAIAGLGGHIRHEARQ